MSTRHIVQQGEHLARLAAQYGFSDLSRIWNHPDNAELRQRRANPNILAPGDELVIPDPVSKVHTVQTGRLHLIVVQRPKLKMRFKLFDMFGMPLADADCILEVEGHSEPLRTDGEGLVERDLPATAENGRLIVGEQEWDFQIGHLDPIEERSGLLARLTNLGYFTGEDPDAGVDLEQLRFAVELFQRDNALPVDGNVSPALLDKLREVYGC